MTKKTSRRDLLKAGAIGGAVLAGIGFDRRAGAQEGVVTQLAKFRLAADKRDEAVAALSELAKAVEDNEPGVLAYIPHTVIDDDTQIVFFEVYENEAARQGHGQQPHMAKLREGFQGGVFLPFAEGKFVEIVQLSRIAGFCR